MLAKPFRRKYRPFRICNVNLEKWYNPTDHSYPSHRVDIFTLQWLEKLLQTIMKIYSDNAKRCEIVNMDANEVVKRYADGKRNFRLTDLKGLNLVKANLSSVDFTGANLSGSNLSNSDLSHANLNWAILKGANLSGANLKGAKMPDGRMHNDYLESANYFGI